MKKKRQNAEQPVPPRNGELVAKSLAPQGTRKRRRRHLPEGGLRGPARRLDPWKVRVAAEGIVRTFVQTGGELWPLYKRHPEWLEELIEKVAGLIEGCFVSEDG
jgi:hypothetical protein